jgi:hypothetical protein
MPIQNSIYRYTILAAGGTEPLDVTKPYTKYVIGSPSTITLLADQEFIHSGTPTEGTTFYIEYLGNIISNYSGGKTVSFFGVDLTDAQANSKCDITAIFTQSGIWNVIVRPDFSEQQMSKIISGQLIEDQSITANSLVDYKITLNKLALLSAQGRMLISNVDKIIQELDVSGDGRLLIGTGTTLNSVPMSGDATITKTGAFTISNSAITTAKIANDNVTVSKVETNLKFELITIEISFESGELGDFKIKLPYSGTVSDIYAYANKAIAGTDNGTIVPKNNGGTTMTGGTITFAASDIRGTSYTSTPSANNSFSAGEILTLSCSKSTAGGKAIVSIKIIRS